MHQKVGIQTILDMVGRKMLLYFKIDFQNLKSANTLKICTSLSKCGLFLESVLHHFLKLELLLGQQKGAIWPSNISFCTLTMYYYVVLQYVTKLPHCGDGRREVGSRDQRNQKRQSHSYYYIVQNKLPRTLINLTAKLHLFASLTAALISKNDVEHFLKIGRTYAVMYIF